ncbi:MAG: hypothetical protein CMF62_03705 [Magnetococcales bacterium]|nr:hypothetical protein [Magnetococcales bacterium]|tara:strand:- start:6145 stop:6381 length:237 start_codon:yes stop_codon:yes gene_type:complete
MFSFIFTRIIDNNSDSILELAYKMIDEFNILYSEIERINYNYTSSKKIKKYKNTLIKQMEEIENECDFFGIRIVNNKY